MVKCPVSTATSSPLARNADPRTWYSCSNCSPRSSSVLVSLVSASIHSPPFDCTSATSTTCWVQELSGPRARHRLQTRPCRAAAPRRSGPRGVSPGAVGFHHVCYFDRLAIHESNPVLQISTQWLFVTFSSRRHWSHGTSSSAAPSQRHESCSASSLATASCCAAAWISW